MLFIFQSWALRSHKAACLYNLNHGHWAVFTREANGRRSVSQAGLLSAVSDGGTFYRVKKGVKHFLL